VLNDDPYFNEAGYESLKKSTTHQTAAQGYTEKVYFQTREFIQYALTNRPLPFGDVLQWLYLDTSEGAPHLLGNSIEDLESILSSSGRQLKAGWKAQPSKGALMILRRKLESLKELRINDTTMSS
jgi:hypothetical protein